MFINDDISYAQMSESFRRAEEQHHEGLPESFDDALFFDCVMLFFGL